MDNKPLLCVGGGAFAFTAVVAYWIFAITLANQLKSDQVSPQKTAEFIHAILEANGTTTPTTWSSNSAVTASRPMNIGAMNEASRFRLSFCWNQAGSWPSKTGFSFRLASLTPIYAWNGANSDLERMGLAAVQKDPSEPHYGVVRRGELRLFQAVYADRAVSSSLRRLP